MRYATALLAALLLAATPALAQTEVEVTFQVDVSALIDACQLDPASGDVVTISGSMNGWDTSADTLEAAGDGVYATTLTLFADSTYGYKFWNTATEYEDQTGDRSFTPTADAQQTVPVVNFADEVIDVCSANEVDYEIAFSVDMSVAALRPEFFDPSEDVVVVAGSINGWSTTADTLEQDFVNPDLYVKRIKVDSVLVPGEIAYKYVIGQAGEAAPSGWESVSDRKFALTGDEADVDNDGYRDVEVPTRYFNNITPDQVFTEETVVTFEVDLRPAFYYLADSLRLPNDTQTGEPVTALNGLYINGPAAGAGDGLTDWATWGPNDLAAIATRELVDDGTNGDAVAGDSVYTRQYTYSAGTPTSIVGKFGTDGYDNEGGFGANHQYAFDPSNPTVRAIFGLMQIEDEGTFVDTDDCGPSSSGAPDVCIGGDYDPYILMDGNGGATVVRRGGVEGAVAVEPVGAPGAAALRGVFPNPAQARAAVEYTLPAAERVSVTLYDMVGRTVATVVDEYQAANTYRADFDVAGLSAGVYVLRLQAGQHAFTQKLTVVR